MNALDVVVEGLFDYAGMYPPASLPFPGALKQAARHPRDLVRPALLSLDMVVREELLAALTSEAMDAAGWRPGTACRIGVVGVPLEAGETTMDKLRAFNDAHADATFPRRVDSVEFVLEGDLVADDRVQRDAVAGVRRALGPGMRAYVEPRWETPLWQTSAARLFEFLQPDSGPTVGLKVRCAGPTAVSPGTMADVLAWVNAAGVPFKATQGLHHPILEEDWDNEWGFLNLAVALRLRGVLGAKLPQEATLRLLAESDPAAYHFTAGAVEWRGHRLGVEELRAGAAAVPFAIGSCSIHEPDADLVRLFD